MHASELLLKALGKNVRILRKGKDWSQLELADQAGLHRTYVADIERGARNISLLSMARLAGALGVRISDLCRDIDREEAADKLRKSPNIGI